MTHSTTKRNGIHYTPPALAQFLARPISQRIKRTRKTFSVLDPACGDGELLKAVLQPLSKSAQQRVRIVGYEQSESAAESARYRLASFFAQVEIRVADFLESQGDRDFEAIISNPPYVRTQVLGAKKAQQLSRQFGLSGRVDLYQAFVCAMSEVLVDGGVLALLTSNRFLTVKSGKALRSLLKSHFQLQSIVDLGDTRLFSAAVLPVIVHGTRSHQTNPHKTGFTRVYSTGSLKSQRANKEQCSQELLAAVQDTQVCGNITTSGGEYVIERGKLSFAADSDIWTLTNPQREQWLKRLVQHQECRFTDRGEIRVGIKTTADSIFIRDDWSAMEKMPRPESYLLRPLVTHHDAARWTVDAFQKQVLYPHESEGGRRAATDLNKYPRAKKYLESHRKRLSARKYLVEGGRHWYEIWVPQNPAQWEQPKLVWPDISLTPKFFLDTTGAIVNGDCYWLQLKPEFESDWLYLILAVANSSVATEFYDAQFHNKLYAGRRRFMTQYIKQFPLPSLDTPLARKIVKDCKQLTGSTKLNAKQRAKLDCKLDLLVRQAFGFTADASI